MPGHDSEEAPLTTPGDARLPSGRVDDARFCSAREHSVAAAQRAEQLHHRAAALIERAHALVASSRQILPPWPIDELDQRSPGTSNDLP